MKKVKKMMLGNTPYVVSRAKARRQKLVDRARLRQLINQSVDQLTVAVGDIGYRTEIDLYAVNCPAETWLRLRSRTTSKAS